MKEHFIADFAAHENETVVSYFAAVQKQVRTTKAGAVYLAVTLCDSTGQVDSRMWDGVPQAATQFEQGDVVKVQAQVCRFDGRLQLKLDKIRKANPTEYDLGDFLPKTTKDVEELWAELNRYVGSFRDEHLKALMRSFLDDPEIAAALRQAPAAKSLHHAWIGGLLEHIVSLLGICDLAASHYTEIHRDLLLTGAMLHDIGKLHELRWGTAFEYTLEGTLVGHITIGVGMVDKKIGLLPDFPAGLRVLVEHMVLSHHGKYEFGSPKLPMIPEAVLLNFLDDMDAKMQILRSEFARNEASGRPAGQFTDWVRAMERPLLNTAGFLAGEESKD
jgi:3'-5' exoribonuclease